MAAAKAVAVVAKAAGPEAAAVPVQVAAVAVLAQVAVLVAAVLVLVAVAVPALAGADHITMNKKTPADRSAGVFHVAAMPRGDGPSDHRVRTGMICFLRLITPGRTTVSPVTVTPKDFSASVLTRSFGTSSVASSFRISTTNRIT